MVLIILVMVLLNNCLAKLSQNYDVVWLETVEKDKTSEVEHVQNTFPSRLFLC